MDEFTVIPALDLKGDAVVHAKSGNRADYRPIESPYGAADDPFAIARGLLSHTASPSLYIADLDAIAGVGNHFELVRGLSYALPDTALWIDAGFSDVADCAFWLPLGATLVIGSESLAGVEDWREIHAAFGEGVVLSLDFDAGGRKGPDALFDDASLWPLRVIAMDLSRVGTDQGPDIGRHQVAGRHGRRAAPSSPPEASGMRAISKRSPHCGRMARCSRRRCIAMPSRKKRSPPSRESGDPSKSVHTPNRQKPSFWSHRRIGPGPPDLPGCPRPGGSPFQPAANGWWAASFLAVTSDAFGSPLTARARASLVAR